MRKRKQRSPWWLSQRLLTKSISMAMQDPEMSMKLASLAMKSWLRFGGDFNPYAAAKAVWRSRQMEQMERRLPPAMERKPEPVEVDDRGDGDEEG